MAFSSPAFLFVFLPVALLGYFLIPKRARGWRNALLLAASLVFYAWGEPVFVLGLIGSILFNYLCALPLAGYSRKKRKTALYVACAGNVGLLFVFKYLGWLLGSLGVGGALPPIALPIGISFFTFQALSYCLDVYRGDAPAQTNLLDLGLYIGMFPQLLSGPIARYRDMAIQLREREESVPLAAEGVRRFSLGLGKKLLIADCLGRVADAVFASDAPGTGGAWLGAACFALQLYFDFSGYSDMAIGLGRIFGFRLPENFRHPYEADSMRGFWRRWHITLSGWFREYVYIPLGGSHRGLRRTAINVLIVFALTGIWHGASWNFLLFGLISGLCIAGEDVWKARKGQRTIPVLCNLYVLLVWLISCVFFRASSIASAFSLLGAMLGTGSGTLSLAAYLTPRFLITLALALVGSTSLPAALGKRIEAMARRRSSALAEALGWAFPLAVFVLSLTEMAVATYRPFLYFRF